MTDLRTAAQQALEALEWSWGGEPMGTMERDAITALRAALVEPACCCGEPSAHGIVHRTDGPCYMAEPVQEPADNGGKTGWPPGLLQDDYRGLSKWLASRPDARQRLREALAEPGQEPQCNLHPKAPHGFLRNASHNEGRYVCECEGWEPYEAGYQAGMEAALAEPVQEPEPVAWIYKAGNDRTLHWYKPPLYGTPLYTAPPQRQPLTEEEIERIAVTHQSLRQIARAIERAHGIRDNP